MIFPDRREDRRAIVINQSENPVIKLIVVLGEVADVRDKNNRSLTKDDDDRQSADSLMPNPEWIKKADECEHERWQQRPRHSRRIGTQARVKTSDQCLSAREL